MYKKQLTQLKDNAHHVETIFEADEMTLKSVPADMQPQALLTQDGIFFLKDVCRCLKLKPSDLKRRAQELERNGQDAWRIMGIRKTWTHWIVRMTVFQHYYRQEQPVSIRRIKTKMDANTLLNMEGNFLLSEVCKTMPFTAAQVRQEVRNSKVDSRLEFGVWKDPNHKGYLVDMPRFAAWIKSIWHT